MNDSHIRQPLLNALIYSIAVTAIIGVILVARDQWGAFETCIILSTVSIGVASICGLACDLTRSHRPRNILPNAGLLLTLVATVAFNIGIWLDLDPNWTTGFWNTTTIVCIFAIATVHVCLLSTSNVANRFRGILMVAYVFAYGMAVILSLLSTGYFNGEQFLQLAAAGLICNVALTLAVPILHRISKSENPSSRMLTPLIQPNIESIDREIDSQRERIQDLERLKNTLTSNENDAG